MMGDRNWPLALTSESSKNQCVSGFSLGVVEGSIDSFLPKALDRMAFQVRGCGSVLGVLETANTPDTLQAPTLFRSAMKKVILALAIIPYCNIRFKETIHSRVPSLAKSLCKTNSMKKQRKLNEYILSSAPSLSSSLSTSSFTSLSSATLEFSSTII
jgi:hypothetical protein